MTEFAKAAEGQEARELRAEELDHIAGGWGVGVFFGVPNNGPYKGNLCDLNTTTNDFCPGSQG